MLLILSAADAEAGPATFFVDPAAVVGAGDGSSGNPWANIQEAVDSAPDGALILVRPGTYNGRQRLRRLFANGITVRSETPYQARLRHTGTVITAYEAQGITLEGFDIAHSGPGATALVIQVQNLLSEPEATSRLTFRNNILHDSFNNDILKINFGARDILVEGNLFYNQEGSDEHIDINSVANVTVRGNVFFNDFAASGRSNNNDTSSFIVIKDSDGAGENFVGSRNITVADNIFLNWQGNTGSNFVLVGEDGNPFFEGFDILVENNLMLGNSANAMRAAFGVKGGRDIVFRHNTVVGDLPANGYAFRLNTEGFNPANENIQFYNNIWSDPTGTLNRFSNTPFGETTSFTLSNNLYFNDGVTLPENGNDMINPSDDADPVVADPLLPGQGGLVAPAWNSGTGFFADGSTSIQGVFLNLINSYGQPAAGSPVIDRSLAGQIPATDILGQPRNRVFASLGAYEVGSEITIFSDSFESP
jgi:hypothetical protein